MEIYEWLPLYMPRFTHVNFNREWSEKNFWSFSFVFPMVPKLLIIFLWCKFSNGFPFFPFSFQLGMFRKKLLIFFLKFPMVPKTSDYFFLYFQWFPKLMILFFKVFNGSQNFWYFFKKSFQWFPLFPIFISIGNVQKKTLIFF